MYALGVRALHLYVAATGAAGCRPSPASFQGHFPAGATRSRRSRPGRSETPVQVVAAQSCTPRRPRGTRFRRCRGRQTTPGAPARWRAVRHVIGSASRGQAPSSSALEAQPAAQHLPLRAVLQQQLACALADGSGSPGCATIVGIRCASRSGARCTQATPSARHRTRSAAALPDTGVVPTSPGPISVSRRTRESSVSSSTRMACDSASRRRNEVDQVGRERARSPLHPTRAAVYANKSGKAARDR